VYAPRSTPSFDDGDLRVSLLHVTVALVPFTNLHDTGTAIGTTITDVTPAVGSCGETSDRTAATPSIPPLLLLLLVALPRLGGTTLRVALMQSGGG
jgi:hypothetical protein